MKVKLFFTSMVMLLMTLTLIGQTYPEPNFIQVDNLDINNPEALTIDEEQFSKTFVHHNVELNGVRVHFLKGGKGKPIFLLHGWPTSWYEWKRVMPLLAEEYTVIVPDLPGAGDSDKPVNAGVKSDIAETIYQLGKHLGYESIYLVGHDWGTSVSFALAHLHPEFVEKLVLTENIIPGLDIPGVGTFEELNAQWWHHLFHAVPDIPELLIQGKEKEYLQSKYVAWTYNNAAFTPDYLEEFVRVYSAPGGLRAGFGFYRALPTDTRDNREFIQRGKLDMPVLVVTGKYQVNELLHRQVYPVVTNYQGVIIDQAKHFLMIETPVTLTKYIVEFVESDPLTQIGKTK